MQSGTRQLLALQFNQTTQPKASIKATSRNRVDVVKLETDLNKSTWIDKNTETALAKSFPFHVLQYKNMRAIFD